MPTDALTMRIAGPDDMADVMVLLNTAARWLATRGIRQWPVEGFPADRIAPHLERGTVYLVETPDGTAVATLTLDGEADPEFWTTADRPADALYLHKLATTRGPTGRGLGSWLLAWACDRAGEAGRRWLRLDCAKHNAGLHAYYRAHGFQHVRTVDLPHRASGALFQRPTTVGYPFAGKPRSRRPVADQREVTTLPRV
jgi:GNAT superfamily N-acetyltransferase